MRKVILATLVMTMLLAMVVSVSAIPAVWRFRCPMEPGVPTTGAAVDGVGSCNFTWAANTTLNITNGYNITIFNYDRTAVASWVNQSGNKSGAYYVLSGSSGEWMIGVWAFNNTNNGGVAQGNWSTSSLNITGDIFDAAAATPSVPSAVIVPVGILGAIGLYFMLRKRRE